jgi:hypothetical protein
VAIPQNVKKKSKSLHPNVHIEHLTYFIVEKFSKSTRITFLFHISAFLKVLCKELNKHEGKANSLKGPSNKIISVRELQSWNGL